MNEISEMINTGFINFESHTLSHTILDVCDDVSSFKQIFLSKKDLELKLNKNINALAYPNGIYSKREIEYAQNAGYLCAFTTNPGYNSLDTNPFKLKRLGINNNSNLNEIIVRTSGLWGYLKNMRKIFFHSEIN